MADTREARTSAREIKFIVDAVMGARIREWARRHLEPDPHGTGPSGDEYRTASLYFDTPQLDVFHRRGSFGRAKYRVRRYGDGDTIFLERKLRNASMLIKRRTKVGLEALLSLEGLSADEPRAGGWFARRVLARGLGPVCQLTYLRMARGVMAPGGPARLTVDEHVRATPIDTVRFSPDERHPVLEGRMIVELKFRAHLPTELKRFVEEFRLSPQVASKYRLGMALVRGLRPEGDEEPEVTLEPDAHV